MQIKIQNIPFVFFLLFSTLMMAQTKSNSTQRIVVAINGSGDYTTIQEAVNSTKDTEESDKVIITIRAGTYKEKLIIPKSKHNLSFIGEDKTNTIITFDDYSGKIDPISNEKHSTFSSHSVLVEGDNIEFHNVTIENSSCNQGQAVALHVEGNQFLISNSNILGCQDTLLTAGTNSCQFYVNCLIEGTTDFIFGPATAVFKNCTIKSNKNSFVTAASTPKKQEFGYIFISCNLIANSIATKVFLGRPWRPFAKTVFIKCTLGNHIVPEGWDPWLDKRFPDKDKTAYYAEYQNNGEGASSSKRVAWSHQISKKESKKYSIKNIFKHCKNWSVLTENKF